MSQSLLRKCWSSCAPVKTTTPPLTWWGRCQNWLKNILWCSCSTGDPKFETPGWKCCGWTLNCVFFFFFCAYIQCFVFPIVLCTYAPDNEWFIETMNTVFSLGGDVIHSDLPSSFLNLLSEGELSDQYFDTDWPVSNTSSLFLRQVSRVLRRTGSWSCLLLVLTFLCCKESPKNCRSASFRSSAGWVYIVLLEWYRNNLKFFVFDAFFEHVVYTSQYSKQEKNPFWSRVNWVLHVANKVTSNGNVSV